MGNTKLRDLLLSVILLGMRFDEIYKDKKISIREIIGSIDEVKDAVEAFKDFKEAVMQYRALDEEGKVALITFFRVKLEIGNDQTEKLIEKGFAWLVSTEDLTKQIKLAIKH